MSARRAATRLRIIHTVRRALVLRVQLVCVLSARQRSLRMLVEFCALSWFCACFLGSVGAAQPRPVGAANVPVLLVAGVLCELHALAPRVPCLCV